MKFKLGKEDSALFFRPWPI